MAQQGGVNVLSGAPFGYRYVRKSDTATAYYEVVEAEAKVLRMVFEIHAARLSLAGGSAVIYVRPTGFEPPCPASLDRHQRRCYSAG